MARSGFVICTEQHAKALDKTVFPGHAGRSARAHGRRESVCFREAMEPSSGLGRQIVANARTLAETLMQGGTRLGFRAAPTTPDALRRDGDRLTGKIAEEALDKAGITVNKNMIPYDQRKPLDPSRHPHRHGGRRRREA